MNPARERTHRLPAALRASLLAASGLALAGLAGAQTTFSVDFRSASVGQPATGSGVPLTEGQILRPATGGGAPRLGPLATPVIAIQAGAGLGLVQGPGCVGHAAGTPCGVEVDALSYGVDAPFMNQGAGAAPDHLWFSVDKWAAGASVGKEPNPFTEGAFGNQEASADVFVSLALPALPVCPQLGAIGAVAAIDGDGLPNADGVAYPGLGLLETNPPVCPPPAADAGDNVDAVDVDGGAQPGGRVFFSLDGLVLDPRCGGLPGTDSAALNGAFEPGDVLTKVPGTPAQVYASAAALGLDLMGAGTDDLDALAIHENGTPGYQRPDAPFGWGPGQGDMVLFSVRSGSALVGLPAGNCGGAPIEPGDVLTAPLVAGGTPWIVVSAEALGLLTHRTDGVLEPDDLDALDAVRGAVRDCNGNGVEDALEVAEARRPDANRNGVPDECEIGARAPGTRGGAPRHVTIRLFR